MKKGLSLLIISVLMLGLLAVPAAAAGTMVKFTPSTPSVTEGQTITYTVSLSGTCMAKSGSVAVSYSDGFELISGEFLKSGATLSKFDTATESGTKKRICSKCNSEETRN